jgi:hypothetical protein
VPAFIALRLRMHSRDNSRNHSSFAIPPLGAPDQGAPVYSLPQFVMEKAPFYRIFRAQH